MITFNCDRCKKALASDTTICPYVKIDGGSSGKAPFRATETHQLCEKCLTKADKLISEFIKDSK